MAATSLADRLRARIAANGPIAVSDFVDAALYDEAEGFYAAGGQAGRRGDFITAPEVGPLFGAVVSNAVDVVAGGGEPGRFVVAEHGAGPGTLARTVTAAGGACLGSGALEWVMVERSDSQRLRHPEGIICGRWSMTVRSIGSTSCSPTNCSTISPSTLFSVAIRVGSSCGSAPTTPACAGRRVAGGHAGRR